MNSIRLCTLLFSAALTSAVAAAPPNIVLIVADDLGYGELGCYGQKIIQTPSIDSLARDGIRFTQFYAGNAVCAPSRCCLMTGKHPGHAYIRNNGKPQDLEHLASEYGWEFPGQNPIPADEVTIAELLKRKGYRTAAFGKWGLGHFGTSGDPNRQGFDLFYGFNCQVHAHNHYPVFLWRNRTKEPLPGNDRTLYGETYSQDRFVEEAISFIEQSGSEPFFAYLPFAVPHLSIQVPQESTDKYTSLIEEEDYKHRGYLEHPTPRAGYAAMVTHMDEGVGKILECLRRNQLEENTIVLFTSDNGPTYDRLGGSDSEFFDSAAGLRGLKGSLYEGGIRVPLVARWPDTIQPGQVTDTLAAFWDLLPTFCELADVEAPAESDGISLVPTLTGADREQNSHEFLYWEFPAYGGQQAVRDARWKAIRQNMLRRNNPAPLAIELYDLKNDAGETKNVADQHPQVVARLKGIMEREHTPSELFPFPVIDRR